MTLRRKKLNIRALDVSFAVCFLLALCFMLWKAPYGFGGSDEAFYLTVPHRLALGDRLFADEWHLSQLSAFFTLPYVRLFRLIVGSNDGIMLTARYTYVVIHSLAAIYLFIRLRRYGASAVFAAIIFMLYTPFDMMCYSYNTIALDMLSLAGVTAGTADAGARASMPLAGFMFACAVICCPYLAAVYALYALIVLLAAIWRRRNAALPAQGLFTGAVFARITLGILLAVVLFAVFFFRHTSVKELFASFPGIFSDPEHPSYSVIFMLKHYIYCLVTAHKLMLLPLALYAVHLAALALDKNRRAHAWLHVVLSSAVALICWALFIGGLTEQYYNSIMLPLAFVGFTSYVLLDEKPRALFAALFVPGVLYSMCVSATSNMGFNVMGMAFSTANIASAVFIGLLLRQCMHGGGAHRAISMCALAAPLVCLAALVVIVKGTHCFWEASPAQLDSVIQDGPARGIITAERLCEDYTRIYDELSEYKSMPGENILVYAQETWCYLILDDHPYAGFSAWLSGLDDTTVERLRLYYSLRPEKTPKYIYILKSTAFTPVNLDSDEIYSAANKNGYAVEESALSWRLEKLA